MGKGISSSEFSAVADDEVSELLFIKDFSMAINTDNVEFSLCKNASFVSFKSRRVFGGSFVEISAIYQGKKKISKKKKENTRNY